MTPSPRVALSDEGRRAAQLLGEYMRTGRTRTDLLKDIAELIVDMRSSYTLDDGRPDLSGRSTGYRREISEVYRRAKVGEEHLDTVQTALRYHVGNLLRERESGDDLEAVGLSTLSPKDRHSQYRGALSAAAERLDGLVADPTRVAVAIDGLLTHLNADVLVSQGEISALAARVALIRARAAIDETIAKIDQAFPRRTRRGGATQRADLN